MKALLIRLYPTHWRARYGDEFLAILEERALGPFDVTDIILGALDAQFRLRRLGPDPSHGRGFTMSLRIGGAAAMIGAPLWSAAFVIGSDTFAGVDPRAPFLLMIAGSLALIVALAGLSAFQARVHPVLSWLAFALPAIGTVLSLVGAAGTALSGDGYFELFFFGVLTSLVGSLFFAIATYRTAVLSRPGALLLGVGTIVGLVAGNGVATELLTVAGLICFTLGWLMLGVRAIRIDGTAVARRPA